MNNKILINISFYFKFILFKNLNNFKLILINNKIIIKIIINKNLKIFLDKNNNSILIYNKPINNNKIKIKNNFENFLKLKNLFLFLKIKFKGKGYKINIFRKKKIINFFFNHSHLTLIKIKKIVILKNFKNKFILINKNKLKLKNLEKLITNIRNANIFTLRGLRSSKKIIFKRKGKKSSYI